MLQLARKSWRENDFMAMVHSTNYKHVVCVTSLYFVPSTDLHHQHPNGNFPAVVVAHSTRFPGAVQGHGVGHHDTKSPCARSESISISNGILRLS